MERTQRLIILDMDNTILQSRIDFPRMKQTIHSMLAENNLSYCERPFVAATLQAYADSAAYDPGFAAELWQAVAQIEDEGLFEAVLEPGATEALAYLSRFASLAVLTNNTEANLAWHLGQLGILSSLDFVAGRGRVGRLKPNPDGFLYVRDQFPEAQPQSTLAVGDALIDAQAAALAGLRFVAYNRSRQEDWDRHGIQPLLRLSAWNEKSCQALLSLVE